MFQCVEDLIECLDRLLSLGGVHPFEKAFDEGIVLQGMFRAPLDHRMRIAPLVTAVARITIDSGAITRDSTSLPWCSGYEDRWTTTSRPDVTVDALVERDQEAAPRLLPPANLPVVRHRRGRLHGADGTAGRNQHCARAEARHSVLQYPPRLLPQLRREARPAHKAVEQGGAAAVPPAAARQRQVRPGR